jgi:hypothetical protein
MTIPKEPFPPAASAPPPRPQTFDEAFKNMTMSEREVTALENDTFKEIDELQKTEKEAAKTPKEAPIATDGSTLPDWVSFPPGFKIPPGKEVSFLYFKAKWTDRPEKGDRWCMLWTLSDADEKLAIKRTRGEDGRSLAELTKGTIRIIDGKRGDWTGTSDAETSYSVDRFWDEIGAKCRELIKVIYIKTHQLSVTERADFLENCCIIRKAIVGG